MKCYFMFLSTGKDLLVFNAQICLTFKRVSVLLFFVVAIVLRSRAYG